MTLSQSDLDFYHENGYLRMRNVYPPDVLAEMSRELDYFIEKFCVPYRGWEGPWRKKYLDDEQEQKALLVANHELQLYSTAWMKAVLNDRLVGAVSDILGPNVELHHTTLHAKTPGFGTPFPMHQDNPFYRHEDGRYVDAIVHVDDADEERGCLKFMPGTHKRGALQHVLEGSPHLPPDEWPIENAVSCPANAGDVVLFSIHTVHGSAMNRSKTWRRLVRFGYRDPANKQIAGQAFGRPGLMVRGIRPKIEGVTIDPFGPWDPAKG